MSTTTTDPRLDEFFQRLLERNPFSNNRVSDPDGRQDDVAEIHDAEYRALIQLVNEAWHEERGIGAVLWGDAGAGKSHLLSRLAACAKEQEVPCVYLHNLQAAPDRIARCVLRHVVSVLAFRGTGGWNQTPLFRLLFSLLVQEVGEASTNWKTIWSAYRRRIDGFVAGHASRSSMLSERVFDVLWVFFRSAMRMTRGKEDGSHAAAAVAWLGGDAVDLQLASEMGLRADRAGDAPQLADDQQVKEALVTLACVAKLARRHAVARPLVLLFDQVDNLDEAQARALFRFLHALIESAFDLVVITAGVRDTMMDFRERAILSEASWARLAEREVRLKRIRHDAGRRIIESRLGAFFATEDPAEEVAELRRVDRLFPLGGGWYQDRTAALVDFRPRDALNWARDRWVEQQYELARRSGREWLAEWSEPRAAQTPDPSWSAQAEIDALLEQALAELVRRLVAAPMTLPPSADKLAGLTESLLEQCGSGNAGGIVYDVHRPDGKHGRMPTFDLIVRQTDSAGRQHTCGLAFVVTTSANSAAASLRRLHDDGASSDRILLVTDSRQPLKPGEAGKEYLELRQRPNPLIEFELSFEQYAALDALHHAVGLARSGELEIRMPNGARRPVLPQEVIESHQRRDRYRNHPLLGLVLQG